MSVIALLAENAVISIACFLLLWLLSLLLKDVSFVDSWWALGMVVLAAATFLQLGAPTPRREFLLGLCTLWGLRLGFYLLWRWRSHGADPRYQTMLGKAQTQRGWGFAKGALLLVFALQLPLQFIVSLPVQLGQFAPVPLTLGPLAWFGVVLATAGILIESIGDMQLVLFKADPINKGKVLDTGLWRYTRHPNYFGDACVWWGFYMIAAETSVGLWALPAPVLMTFLLTRWSGVPAVEGRMKKRRSDYADYIGRTSGFIPWPPKRSA